MKALGFTQTLFIWAPGRLSEDAAGVDVLLRCGRACRVAAANHVTK